MQLRAYQKQALEQTLAKWADYDRLLGVAAVGAGKTIIAAAVIQARLGQGRALFLTQAIDKLHRAAGIVAAREQAGDAGINQHRDGPASAASRAGQVS